MEISQIINDYPELIDIKENYSSLLSIINESSKNKNPEVLKNIFSLIDLTTLDVTDTSYKVVDMCNKVNDFTSTFNNIPNIAAICVYPSLIKTVKESLIIEDINIASVVGGFPASQTYTEIKALETAMAIKHGATEADMVISVGKFLSSDYQGIFDEISILKTSAGKAHLKVILETGALTEEQIYMASLIAMEAGADFIKTSTGKFSPAATPEAAFIMCLAIKEFYNKTGTKIGLKPAGGISTSDDALIYYTIVDKVLGVEWLNNKLFRFGASRLANNILTEISQIEGFMFNGKYF